MVPLRLGGIFSNCEHLWTMTIPSTIGTTQKKDMKLFGFHPRVSFAPPSPVGPWRLWPRQGWSGSNGTSRPPASDPSEASVVGPLASCQLLANHCFLASVLEHLNSIPSQREFGTCFMSGVWQLPRWTWNAPKWQFKHIFWQTKMQPRKKTPTTKNGSGFEMKESHGLEDKEKGREVGFARLGIPIARLMALGELRYNLKDKQSTGDYHPSERSRLDGTIEENRRYKIQPLFYVHRWISAKALKISRRCT